MTKFHLFFYNSEEWATILERPLLTVEAETVPTELKHEWLVDAILGLSAQAVAEVDMSRDKLMAMAPENLVEEVLWDDLSVCASHVGVVPDDPKILARLKTVGKRLLKRLGECGSDSAYYEVARDFVEIVQSVEVGRIQLPSS